MRTIRVKVIPNAKKDAIVEESGIYKVYLRAPASGGRANKALVKIVAGHFGAKKNGVRILRGVKSREKLLEIDA